MHHFEKQIQIWSHFFGESGYKMERLHITSHEVYHEGLLEAAIKPPKDRTKPRTLLNRIRNNR